MGCGKQGTVRLGIAVTVVQSDPKLRRRATPHPALRATFPSKLEKESGPVGRRLISSTTSRVTQGSRAPLVRRFRFSLFRRQISLF